MGKRTLPAAYLTAAPPHPQLRLGSPVPSTASSGYTLPVLEPVDLEGLARDDVENLWSDRYEYEVPIETKHEFLRRFGLNPEHLPPGRVEDIFNAWIPDDPPPEKADEPDDDIINPDDDRADDYFLLDDDKELQENRTQLDLDPYNNDNYPATKAEPGIDADGDIDYAPYPYDPYADNAIKHPSYPEPEWLRSIVLPPVKTEKSRVGNKPKDTRKPQQLSLGDQVFDQVSPTVFSSRVCPEITGSPPELLEINIFLQFFPTPLMERFAQYTNARFHASQHPDMWKDDSRFWRWYDTSAAELYVFLGIVVYLSSHFEDKIDQFWAKTSDSCPTHPLRRYMARDRFRLLFRFFSTWCPTSQRGADPFTRVDRLAEQIRNTSQKLWQPGTSFAVDEAICKFFGRSQAKLRFPNKPIKVGLKAFCLGWRGYVFNFTFVGQGTRITNMPATDDLSWPEYTMGMAPTQRCVWWLCKALPPPPPGHLWYHLFVDNLFPTQALLNALREIGVATSGTARVGLTGMSAYFTSLKKAQDKVPWGETLRLPTIDGRSMGLAWKDSAIVLLISNVFSGGEDPVIRQRKMARDSIAEKKKQSLHAALGNQARAPLPIPLIIDTYNQNMNGIDIADHYRSLSQIGRRRFCRGPAQALIFDFLLGITIANCFILAHETRKSSLPPSQKLRYTQGNFREALFEQLMAKFCGQATQQRGPTMEQIKRDSPRAPKPTTASPAADHTPLFIPGQLNRTSCKACSLRFRRAVKKPYSRSRQNLKTSWGCSGCLDSRGKPVPLHYDGDCFEVWHSGSGIDLSPIVDVNSSFSSATTEDTEDDYFEPVTPTPRRR